MYQAYCFSQRDTIVSGAPSLDSTLCCTHGLHTVPGTTLATLSFWIMCTPNVLCGPCIPGFEHYFNNLELLWSVLWW